MIKYLFFLIFIFPISASADPFGQLLQQNNINPSTSASCSYTPPLDANSATLAYSFRLLKTSYSGGNVVTIKRSSDSTTKTFALTAPNCTINQSDPFFDASTYTIVTWFDQSGSGKNITATNNPTITLSCQNGQPCINFASASSQYLSSNTALSINANTMAVVGELTDTTASHVLMYIGDGSGGGGASQEAIYLFHSSAGTMKMRRDNSGTTLDGFITDANNTWYRLIGTVNTTLSRVFLSGTQGTDVTTSQGITSSGWVCVGCLAPSVGAATFMQGHIAEAIAFSPDISSTNSNTVSSNQGTFWGIP